MPIKYVPFIPEPVEGQAVLGNFNRVLKYKGADDVSMTLQRGMPLYEMEKQETVGEKPDGNMIIRGECVSACAYLKEQGVQVDHDLAHCPIFKPVPSQPPGGSGVLRFAACFGGSGGSCRDVGGHAGAV